MIAVELRFYEELNDFLPRERRQTPFAVAFTESRPVKDLIESLGVPHTEVDLILVNGESAEFDRPVRDGDRISVYPKFETFDIGRSTRLGRPPLRECRFIADVHLGKLVRRLRLLGFDCLYHKNWNDAELAACSATDGRILLTRDRGLLKRAIVTHGICLHSDQPDLQLREVVERLDLYRIVMPLVRCMHCNGILTPVVKESVKERVPAMTFRYVDDFFRCGDCHKIFWKGTHWPRLEKLICAALAPPGKERDRETAEKTKTDAPV